MNPTTLPLGQPPADSAMPQPPALERALAEPFAFALLQWPLLLAVLHLDRGGGWWLALRVACGLLLALALLAAYARGLGFGNAMTAAAGCVAGAWWSWPTGWAVAWLALLALLLLAAQTALLRRLLEPGEAPSGAERRATPEPAARRGAALTPP